MPTQTRNPTAIGEVLALVVMYRAITQSGLSEMSGVSQPAINRILHRSRSDSTEQRQPHASTLLKLCKTLDITPDQLTGKSPLTPQNLGRDTASILNIADVPLIVVDDIEHDESGFRVPKHVTRKWLGCPVTHSEKTFVFRVRTAEMSGLGQFYMSGDLVFIDPEVSPEVGDDVLAITRDKAIIFRRMHFYNGHLYLSTINPRDFSQLIQVDDCQIIGTAIVTCRVRKGSAVLGEFVKMANYGENSE